MKFSGWNWILLGTSLLSGVPMALAVETSQVGMLAPLTAREFEDARSTRMSLATALHVEEIMRTIVLDNSIAAPASPGPRLRVLAYNLDQDREFAKIRALLGDTDRFVQAYAPGADAETLRQLRRAMGNDIVLVSEVDIGTCRSGFTDGPAEFARAWGMNYAFNTEFLELNEPMNEVCQRRDYRSVRGLTGNAIFSRYPIRNPRRIELKRCYDWFETERQSLIHKLKLRHAQVRRGDRNALAAEIELPPPYGLVTVVSTHLEVHCNASCRAEQMKQILDEIGPVDHPVIIGGDLNTYEPGDLTLRKEWKAAGFDLSGNDMNTTQIGEGALHQLRFRLDWLGTRASSAWACFRPEAGETLTAIRKNHLDVSDHLPIVLEIPTACPAEAHGEAQGLTSSSATE